METLKNAYGYAGSSQKRIKIAFLLILMSVFVGIAPYYFAYKLLLPLLDGSKNVGMMPIVYVVAIAFALSLKGILFYMGLDASHQAAFATLKNIRVALADKLLHIPLGALQNKGAGSYKKTFVEDIDSVEALLAHMIPEGIPYVLNTLIVYIILFFMDYRLALLAMASLPFGLIAMGMMMYDGYKRMGPYFKAAETMNGTIVEYVAGMSVIKIFGRTVDSFNQYVQSVEHYRDYTLDWYKISWNYMALYGAVLPCTLLFLLPVGMNMYLNGAVELDMLLLSILLAVSIATPLVKMLRFGPIIPQLIYKLKVLEDALESDVLESGNDAINFNDQEIRFENVFFAYENKTVIHDLSFTLKPNTLTAIVGESGSGKSTIARLLVHYWDVNKGAIYLGNHEIRKLSFENLMSQISYVSQDNYLFDLSINENIRIGKPNASDDEVVQACKTAMCDGFISHLDKGYDTFVGESGGRLSGGERQRITIARAILKNAPIVLLDEATSFTDPENEDKLQESINGLTVNKTVIVIAHRLSTIIDADQILVMEEGRLVGQGTHHMLLESSPTYQRLWKAHCDSQNWGMEVHEQGGLECSESSNVS